MADWDEDSPRLRANLAQVLRGIQRDSGSRKKLSLGEARRWHRESMEGLEVAHPEFRGGFRGEAGALRDYDVEIGSAPGVPSTRVAAELENSRLACSKRSAFWIRRIPWAVNLMPMAWRECCNWRHGRTPNGCAFIRSPTAMVAPHVCGRIPFCCVTAFPLSFACVRGLTAAMNGLQRTPCRATGNRLMRSSSNC